MFQSIKPCDKKELERKLPGAKMSSGLSETTSECETIMEVREYDGTSYEYTSDINTDVEEIVAISKARRTTQVIARKSLIWAREYLEKLPIKLTLGNLGFFAIILAIMMPRAFTYILVYPIFRLVFGTLYPAYASYKAVRTKNVKEYVKWMMYWIVFALFTCAETFTDVFFSFWFPFYYEIKIILVLWLLSPATKGSSILYRRFVHPALSRREAEIDDALARATEQGYTAVLHLGTRGVNYATTVLMQTAIKGGGGLVQQLKKSYSLSDLTGEKEDENRNTSVSMRDETDMEVEPRRREHPGRRGYSPRRTQSSSNRVEMYFSEVDVDVRQPRPRDPIASLNNIRSSDDISSGYSSGEALQPHRVTSQGESLLRTSSVGARTRVRPRSSTTKKTPEVEEDDYELELDSTDRQQFPSPLSLLSARQTLELVLLLSQINPNENSAIYDSIASSFGNQRSTMNNLRENVEISSPEPRDSLEEELTTKMSCSQFDATVNDEIVEKSKVEICGDSEEVPKDKIETSQVVDEGKIIDLPQVTSGTQVERNNHSIMINDDICQGKLDELKVLLSNARKAVTNIVSSHEKLQSTEKLETIETTTNLIGQNETYQGLETSSHDSLEVWTTPNVSRSNSDSDCRAGRYNKKPAPKAPISKSEDEHEETASQSALKATLVIKTGTLKTFTNVSQTKNVFVSHLPDSTKLKKKKLRRKEGFSKLLTIPKTFFNHAFHKEQKDTSGKDEDSSSVHSERASTSRSRSVSFGSQGDTNHRDSAVKPIDNIEDVLRKVALAADDNKTDTYVDFRTDSLDRCESNEEGNSTDKIHDNDNVDIPVEVSQNKSSEEADKIEKKVYSRTSLKIRQMSHSPTRNLNKSFHDDE